MRLSTVFRTDTAEIAVTFRTAEVQQCTFIR